MSATLTRGASGLCKECRQGLVFDYETAENICMGCGVVDSTSPEVLEAPREPLGSVKSQPESRMMYDLQLDTLIGGQNVDANGHHIGTDKGFDQLRRLNNMTISRSTKMSNEMKASFEIERITTALRMPASVRFQAEELYRRGLGAGIVTGKSISNMSAASVMIAASGAGVPCSSDDIENSVETVSGRTARRYYKLLIRGLNIGLEHTTPAKHVSGIAGRAGLSTKVERRALEILSIVNDSASLTDKRPVSLAGAALYLASMDEGERINQLRLAYAAGITPITIRKRSTEISEILKSAREAKELLDELREEEREDNEPVRTPALPQPILETAERTLA